MNKVILMGRLTRDITTHYTPSGKFVANFTIAVRRKFQSEGRTADFINCIAWGKTGEFANFYFKKGSMIAVEGRLQSSTWGTQDGKTNYSTEIVIEEIFFTGEKKSANQPYTDHTATQESKTIDDFDVRISNDETLINDESSV